MTDNTASAKAEKEEIEDTAEDRTIEASFNLAEIRELAELVNEYGFTDFRFENENIKVRLSKQLHVPMMQTVPSASPAQFSASNEATTASAPSHENVETDPDEGLHVIPSPIVGTFYRAPGPDKEPYVKIGSMVSPDSVVCIVEAMKLMNEIQAETAGEIAKIYVENGEPVEYGQPLFGIRK